MTLAVIQMGGNTVGSGWHCRKIEQDLLKDKIAV